MIWHQHKAECSLQEEKVPSFPFRTFQYLKRTYMKAGERFLEGCVVIEQEGMASNWIRLDIGMKFFTERVRVARYWHELPKEAVAALSLKELKVRLNGALTNLIVRVSLPKAGAWNWMILWPFPTQAILWFFWFCDFMISPDYLKMLLRMFWRVKATSVFLFNFYILVTCMNVYLWALWVVFPLQVSDC